jgi:hypothetical protein
MAMIGHMNDTRWDEIRLAMYSLRPLAPQWRTKDRLNAYVSAWDGEWFHHFRQGGYETIEWLELKTVNLAQHESVRAELRKIHVPGEEIPNGFRVLGFTEAGQSVDYL